MSSTYIILLLCTFLSLAIVYKLITKITFTKPRRPPGPRRLPVIGNILSFGIFPHRMMPHQTIAELKAKYGPVLRLQLGMSKIVVIQSAKAAEELYKKHDLTFSDRFVPDSVTACDYDKGSVIVARYGEYWRFARKLCSSELLAHKKVSASAPTRQTCIDIMMRWIKEDSDCSRGNGGSGEIHLEKYLMLMIFNILSNFTMSKDIMDSKSDNGSNELYEAMTGFMEWSGTPNVVDTFPFLKWIDPQGIRRNSGKHLKKIMNVIDGLVKERIQEKKLGKEKDGADFLDALLDYGGKDELTKKNVTILIMEMFIAGTETSSTTINWGMAELLRNPETMRKLKHEIDQFTFKSSRMIEEDDIAYLPYLQAVMKETMRMHPSVALIPRNTIKDTQFMAYFIPKNTIMLVNLWAIQRDPETWEAPLSFKPERFLDSNIDSKGLNFELIPFGLGRRSCIGMFLADKMVGLTLAKLVQTFDWKLPMNASPDTLDMRERNGLSIRKRVPLMVIPVERKS